MILATKDKSPFGGKDIFVPHFLTMPIKERNKVHRYAGRYREDEDTSLLSDLAVPLIGLGLLGGIMASAATGHTIVALTFCALMLTPLLAALGWAVISGLIGQKEPQIPIVHQDDVHWSMLLVAFSDNKALWDRLTNVLKNGNYMWDTGLWCLKEHHTPLMRELDTVISVFMISADPTVEDARIVHANVERIFAKYDQKVLEKNVATEAAKEIEAASEVQLFDFQVQMARADTNHYAITTDLLY